MTEVDVTKMLRRVARIDAEMERLMARARALDEERLELIRSAREILDVVDPVRERKRKRGREPGRVQAEKAQSGRGLDSVDSARERFAEELPEMQARLEGGASISEIAYEFQLPRPTVVRLLYGDMLPPS